ILDFDGGLISDQEMMEGGWPASDSPLRPSLRPVTPFHTLFNSDYSPDDINAVEHNILDQVQKFFAPYQADFTIGINVADYEGLLTGSQTGDAIVMITGGSNIFAANGGQGASPRVDVGNHGNELAFVFGQYFSPADVAHFDYAVAKEIAH